MLTNINKDYKDWFVSLFHFFLFQRYAVENFFLLPKIAKVSCFWDLCTQDEVKMNQLQSLIHDALIGTGHVAQCAILRRKDGIIRASSVGFQVLTISYFPIYIFDVFVSFELVHIYRTNLLKYLRQGQATCDTV